jgi:hypothetical protein
MAISFLVFRKKKKADFTSLESLKVAIAEDIEYAKTQCVQSEEAAKWRESSFWRDE